MPPSAIIQAPVTPNSFRSSKTISSEPYPTVHTPSIPPHARSFSFSTPLNVPDHPELSSTSSTSSFQASSVSPPPKSPIGPFRPRSKIFQRNSTLAYNKRLKSLARRKHKLQECLQILNEMRLAGVQPDKYTYSMLLTSCIKCNDPHTAVELYHDIRKDGIPLDEHLRASLLKIAATHSSPQIGLCIRLFRGTSRPNRIMCNVMMDAFASIGDVDNCLSTYRYMRSVGVTPDGYTVCAIIKAYVHLGKLDDAMTNLHEMIKSAISVPPAAFCMLITAYGRMGRLDDAVTVYDRMTEWHVAPSQVTYNVLINACAVSGDLKRANEIYEEMKHTSPFSGDRYTMHGMIKCCLRRGDGRSALRWYEKIKASPVMPNQVSFRLALTAAGQNLDLDAVHQIADDIRAAGVKPREDVAATLVAASIRCSDLQAATTFFRSYAHSMCGAPLQPFFDSIRSSLRAFEQHMRPEVADYNDTFQVVRELEKFWAKQTNQK